MRSRLPSSIKTAAFLAAGLVAGLTIASLTRPDAGEPRTADGAADASLAGRIATLEQSLRRETARREALADEVGRLRNALEGSDGGAAPAGREGAARDGVGRAIERAGAAAEGSAATAEAAGAEQAPRSRGGRFDAGDVEGWRVERLVDAGFAPDRAAWIGRRTEELRMQALEDQYRAARSGEGFDPRASAPADAALRAELGDEEYERYLGALGRPTRIGVRSVLASSPAEQAGILPGDEVVGYGGQRVFDVGDLNRLTLEGQPGETVALDVVRDGQAIQLYVPRGPIGIVGGGRRGSRP